MKIYIINGANLNTLGVRQPEIYGNVSFETYFQTLQNECVGVELVYFQSNYEGAIIDALQACQKHGANGVVINAGAYTHTSVALGDALAALTIPIIEVHISNIFAREPYRHTSYLSAHCQAVICGAGLQGYHFAVQLLTQKPYEKYY
jgi:3-dehydroquinate dehydratase-2